MLADPDPALPPESRTQLRQLSNRVFGLSDLGFGGVGLLLFFLLGGIVFLVFWITEFGAQSVVDGVYDCWKEKDGRHLMRLRPGQV